MVKRVKSGWARSLPVTDKAFRPYAIALGQIALAWNEFHQALALLFCSVMGGGFVNQFLAIWNAIRNDRAQREILKAAALNNTNGTMPPEMVEGLVKLIEWINARANEVEDARDDALHSPLLAFRGTQNAVFPAAGLGHKRAEKLLKRKDLLAEFRWCRDSAMTLTEFAFAIDNAWARGLSWPDTPTMPNRGETNKQRPPHQAH
jgi:hypothetical protein